MQPRRRVVRISLPHSDVKCAKLADRQPAITPRGPQHYAPPDRGLDQLAEKERPGNTAKSRHPIELGKELRRDLGRHRSGPLWRTEVHAQGLPDEKPEGRF